MFLLFIIISPRKLSIPRKFQYFLGVNACLCFYLVFRFSVLSIFVSAHILPPVNLPFGKRNESPFNDIIGNVCIPAVGKRQKSNFVHICILKIYKSHNIFAHSILNTKMTSSLSQLAFQLPEIHIVFLFLPIAFGWRMCLLVYVDFFT